MGRLTMARVAGALAVLAVWAAAEDKLVFFDDFNQLDMRVWRHELTMSGGGCARSRPRPARTAWRARGSHPAPRR